MGGQYGKECLEIDGHQGKVKWSSSNSTPVVTVNKPVVAVPSSAMIDNNKDVEQGLEMYHFGRLSCFDLVNSIQNLAYVYHAIYGDLVILSRIVRRVVGEIKHGHDRTIR